MNNKERTPFTHGRAPYDHIEERTPFMDDCLHVGRAPCEQQGKHPKEITGEMLQFTQK